MTSVTVTSNSEATVNKSRVSKTEIKLATVDEMLAKASVLFEEHYEEIARNKEVMKLKPDEKAYRNLEEANQIFILSAWQDDVLIGYSVNFVLNHPHYADLLLAQNDLLYIKKEMRGSRAGLRLIKETETHATSLGCKLMLWHAKENTALGAILPRLKYGVQDIIYSKEL
tara:strand:+ start:863 stop:1372 length:510 start_codon:yes stop_codon:yes gene_type:complete